MAMKSHNTSLVILQVILCLYMYIYMSIKNVQEMYSKIVTE